MLHLWNILRTCLEVVKLKGFQQERFRICKRRAVLRSSMELFKSISRLSVIKVLSPSICTNENACF